MKNQATWLWLGLGAGAIAGLYYLQSQGLLPAAATATPLSIYPELAYTKTTSMAATPGQKATTTVVPPTPYFSSVQQAEQAAIYGQCVGASVCSPLSGDMQLGL